MTFRISLVGILVAASIWAFAQYSKPEPAGMIIFTRGMVQGQNEDGNRWSLYRRSSVYPGDTIITGANSSTQIRFTDGGLLAMDNDSVLVIEDYQYNESSTQKSSAAYRLMKGGMQAVTGIIGVKYKENFRFDTPVGNIGLRGTHWGAQLCFDRVCKKNGEPLPEGLYGGVADGGIEMCNDGGCGEFDKGVGFYAKDKKSKPVALDQTPDFIFDY